MFDRSENDQEEDIEIVPIPMTAETRARLKAFAEAVGMRPIEVAGRLFSDLMADDEFWNAAQADTIIH